MRFRRGPDCAVVGGLAIEDDWPEAGDAERRDARVAVREFKDLAQRLFGRGRLNADFISHRSIKIGDRGSELGSTCFYGKK